MRVIDEKGKLFGKLNLIDFLVILILVCALPVFYATTRMINKTSKLKPQEETLDLYLEGHFIKLNPDVAKIISVGDKERDGNGKVIAEIVKIGEMQPYEYNFNFGDGRILIKEDKKNKQADVRLHVKAAIRNNMPYYKEQQITVDNPLEFITDKYDAIFIIPKIKKLRRLSLYIKSYRVLPEIANKIQVGDAEKDDEGKEIALLTAIAENRPTELFKFRNNISRDMTLRFSVSCEDSYDACNFKNVPIELGNQLGFSTDVYSISGTIVGVERNDVK
jgi:hypothetical protein